VPCTWFSFPPDAFVTIHSNSWLWLVPFMTIQLLYSFQLHDFLKALLVLWVNPSPNANDAEYSHLCFAFINVHFDFDSLHPTIHQLASWCWIFQTTAFQFVLAVCLPIPMLPIHSPRFESFAILSMLAELWHLEGRKCCVSWLAVCCCSSLAFDFTCATSARCDFGSPVDVFRT